MIIFHSYVIKFTMQININTICKIMFFQLTTIFVLLVSYFLHLFCAYFIFPLS